jgi:hypothetical protein
MAGETQLVEAKGKPLVEPKESATGRIHYLLVFLSRDIKLSLLWMT